MAVVANLEKKSEDAWAVVLNANTDLQATSGLVIAPFHSAVTKTSYPLIVIDCLEEQHEFATVTQYSMIFVSIRVYTHRTADKSGAECQRLLGAVRDSFSGCNLLKQLNSIAGYNVTKCLRSGSSFTADQDRLHGLGVTFDMFGVAASDIPDRSSSSSSSSSNSVTTSSSSSSSTLVNKSSSSSSSNSSSQSSSSFSSTSESSANTSSSTSVSSFSSTSESSG